MSHPAGERNDIMATRHPNDPGTALQALRAEAMGCRACPLWRDATQTVFGQGPAPASLMLVGEQPGDKEDLAGLPFVGPAGQVLDQALDEAEIERGDIYVTNAVKHFKFLPHGKRRLHQKAVTPEIRACRPWLERELDLVRPRLVLAMGATAAQAVFGKMMPIGRNRGRVMETAGGTDALITVHPSYLLRIPEPDRKEEEYRRFIEDLRQARDTIAAGSRRRCKVGG
jgi:uracil-DNA glycosylase family protein